ncbi:RpiB/LacA/LacB family sugar-phosphate isomerase [archaeon]|jgi:ribose 5-phosphate isomerase B|nr:RpiB/LacA/LacB family sugar-phosphate isomerase [archaeon]MBT6821130.1 RpiB/LacA/LacB family sugar-phosphate isomerase [archaeon]MBT7391702.1 RpiB/LacA/LacB family sugar-phosphate isomerase [archaeon]
MTIYLGADHGGLKLKNQVIVWLKEWGYEFEDMGPFVYDAEDDYPDFAIPASEKVGIDDDSDKDWKDRRKGILVCRSAGGVIFAACKVKNIRAVAVSDELSAKHARLHNDANIIALSGDWTSEEDAKKIVKVWLETEFSRDERHVRRINKIKAYESLGE